MAEEGRGCKDTSSQMSPGAATPQVEDQWAELQVDAQLPEAGLCSRYHLYPPSSSPGLSQPPCPSSAELLPACLPFLPLPPPPTQQIAAARWHKFMAQLTKNNKRSIKGSLREINRRLYPLVKCTRF